MATIAGGDHALSCYLPILAVKDPWHCLASYFEVD